MITGFNTDIKHDERIFHVQTEDRGQANPVVESLVYVGGEILLSKKSPYANLVRDDHVDEKAVRQMMDNQHRLIIEAIRRGRFDAEPPGEAPPMFELDELPAASISPAAAAASALLSGGEVARSPSGRVVGPPPAARAPAPSSLPIAPTRSLPAGATGLGTAGQEPGQTGGPAKTLDQVIIDYLASEAASERLEIVFQKLGGDLVAGETCVLVVKASTSLTGRPVPGTKITIRMIVSTAGPPQILFRGQTGSDGMLRATVSLPEIGNANAALIVAGTSAIGNHEVKQLIRRK